MALYEVVAIVRPDVTNAQAESLLQEISTIAANNNGTVVKSEYWGLRNIAYRMKKNRKGHYLYLDLSIDSTGLNEFNRLVGLHEDIMRALTVRVEAHTEGPSIMLINKKRDERDAEFGSERSDSRPRQDGYRPRPRHNVDADA